MHIAVHSPWLPGHIDVPQTVLVILTMAGLFLGRQYTVKKSQQGNVCVKCVSDLGFCYNVNRDEVEKHAVTWKENK